MDVREEVLLHLCKSSNKARQFASAPRSQHRSLYVGMAINWIPCSYGGGGMKHLLHFEICVVEHTEHILCMLKFPGSILAFLDKTGISIWNLVELLSIGTNIIELDEQMIWHRGIPF